MKTAIIGCQIIEEELKHYLPEGVFQVWLERGLHDRPEKLRATIQQSLDDLPEEIDTVLLGYGLCGNALDGISSGTKRLVLPLFDDCINMMLTRKRSPTSMYYTPAWFVSDRFVGNEFTAYREKFGLETTREIYEMMFANYTDFCLLETGLYNVEDAIPIIETAAKNVGLPWRKEPADTRILRQLATGEWNEKDFWIVEPGQTICMLEFMERRTLPTFEE